MKKSSNDVYTQQQTINTSNSNTRQHHQSNFLNRPIVLPSNQNKNLFETYRVEPLELYDNRKPLEKNYDDQEEYCEDEAQNMILNRTQTSITNSNYTQIYDENRNYAASRKTHEYDEIRSTNTYFNDANECTKTSYKDINRNQYYDHQTVMLSKEKNRTYMSSIEIPAEHLQQHKEKQNRFKQRSKSESASEYMDSASNRFDLNDESFNDACGNKKVLRKKRCKSSELIASNVVKKIYPAESNILSVSLKSLKLPQPEKETMTEENFFKTSKENRDHVINETNRNNRLMIEKFQREIDELRLILNEKNQLLSLQGEQQRQMNDLKTNEIMICHQKNENLNRMLENQKFEIINLKNKLSKFEDFC
jgi:hypothetical protein